MLHSLTSRRDHALETEKTKQRMERRRLWEKQQKKQEYCCKFACINFFGHCFAATMIQNSSLLRKKKRVAVEKLMQRLARVVHATSKDAQFEEDS